MIQAQEWTHFLNEEVLSSCGHMAHGRGALMLSNVTGGIK